MSNKTAQTFQKVKGISLRLLIALAVFCVILLLFLYITDEIVLENESGFDNSIFQFLKGYTTPAVTGTMIFFTFFGSMKFLFPAYCILVLYFLLYKKNKRRSFNIAAIGISSIAILFLIKDIFKRHRPSDPLIANIKGFSFPSGHSTSAFTFFGLLIYIIWESQVSKWLKWTGSVLLFFFAVAVATSRVYLHVHYASDVAAGFCLAILWLTICIFVLHKIERNKGLKKNDKEIEY